MSLIVDKRMCHIEKAAYQMVRHTRVRHGAAAVEGVTMNNWRARVGREQRREEDSRATQPPLLTLIKPPGARGGGKVRPLK